jgi:hypothetical protein
MKNDPALVFELFSNFYPCSVSGSNLILRQIRVTSAPRKRVLIFTLQRVHDARSLEAIYFIDH